MAHKIIIDTDPGIDDAVALAFALRSPEVELLGLTTVFGNGGVDQSTLNALRILELARRPDIPVARGAGRPLILAPRFGASHMHGQDGLGNMGGRLPAPTRHPIDMPAASFIVETVLANPGEVTLVPVGPLSNIALAARLNPAIVEQVRRMEELLAPAGVPIAAAALQFSTRDPRITATIVGMSAVHDAGAYLVGRKIGRHPMAPKTSPGKTWEGFASGTVVMVGLSCAVLPFIHPFDVLLALKLALVMSVSTPLGDLVESLLKRDLGVKDFGTLLPGHGGFLDRFDGLLFALPVAYYVTLHLKMF